ncbi:MAG: alpha/beta hydrolase [Marinomonas sp.]
MIDLPQKRVRLANGIELDVVDEGPHDSELADAPVLIFLHGFPENHRTWRHQIKHFSESFRCVAPDQRGYMGSSKPEGLENYTPDQMIGDVFLLADALGIAKFTIVGHDWGGAIAWGVAIGGQHMRVERLIIANAPHPVIFPKLLWTSHHQRESSQYMRDFRDPVNDALVAEKGLGGLLDNVTNWQATGEMEPEEREALLKSWENREAAMAMLNWYRATPLEVPPMDAPFELPEGFEPPQVPDLSIPTLVMWGMDDLALPPENLDGMEDMIEELTLVKIPGAAHFIPWEAPKAVTSVMDDFVNSTLQTQPTLH